VIVSLLPLWAAGLSGTAHHGSHMKQHDRLEIDPAMATELWGALFAVIHAVEHLDMTEAVNSYRRQSDGLGAHELARMVIDTASATLQN